MSYTQGGVCSLSKERVISPSFEIVHLPPKTSRRENKYRYCGKLVSARAPKIDDLVFNAARLSGEYTPNHALGTCLCPAKSTRGGKLPVSNCLRNRWSLRKNAFFPPGEEKKN